VVYGWWEFRVDESIIKSGCGGGNGKCSGGSSSRGLDSLKEREESVIGKMREMYMSMSRCKGQRRSSEHKMEIRTGV
jgi:hypothetical protein